MPPVHSYLRKKTENERLTRRFLILRDAQKQPVGVIQEKPALPGEGAVCKLNPHFGASALQHTFVNIYEETVKKNLNEHHSHDDTVFLQTYKLLSGVGKFCQINLIQGHMPTAVFISDLVLLKTLNAYFSKQIE